MQTDEMVRTLLRRLQEERTLFRVAHEDGDSREARYRAGVADGIHEVLEMLGASPDFLMGKSHLW